MITTPKIIDNTIRDLLRFLELKQTNRTLLKLSKTKCFNPVPKNCHINTWIQRKLEGGSIQYGWVIWRDDVTGLTEAEFHSVWKNKKGDLLDITPRIDGEKKILFVPDFIREIYFERQDERLIINTYDNVRIINEKLWNGVTPTKAFIIPIPKIVHEFGLLSDL